MSFDPEQLICEYRDDAQHIAAKYAEKFNLDVSEVERGWENFKRAIRIRGDKIPNPRGYLETCLKFAALGVLGRDRHRLDLLRTKYRPQDAVQDPVSFIEQMLLLRQILALDPSLFDPRFERPSPHEMASLRVVYLQESPEAIDAFANSINVKPNSIKKAAKRAMNKLKSAIIKSAAPWAAVLVLFFSGNLQPPQPAGPLPQSRQNRLNSALVSRQNAARTVASPLLLASRQNLLTAPPDYLV